jgi:hypothetical protein
MGVLCDFFISENGQAASYDGSKGWPADDRAEWKGMTTLELTTLWAIVEDRNWEVERLDAFENILTANGGHQLTERIPDDLVHALSSLQPSALDSIAERWVETEELSDWSSSEGREVLDSLVRLSRRAVETQRNLYIWSA